MCPPARSGSISAARLGLAETELGKKVDEVTRKGFEHKLADHDLLHKIEGLVGESDPKTMLEELQDTKFEQLLRTGSEVGVKAQAIARHI